MHYYEYMIDLFYFFKYSLYYIVYFNFILDIICIFKIHYFYNILILNRNNVRYCIKLVINIYRNSKINKYNLKFILYFKIN